MRPEAVEQRLKGVSTLMEIFSERILRARPKLCKCLMFGDQLRKLIFRPQIPSRKFNSMLKMGVLVQVSSFYLHLHTECHCIWGKSGGIITPSLSIGH